MSEAKLVSVGMENGNVVIGFDGDKDGSPSLSLKLNLAEDFKEIFSKGVAVEGVKAASIRAEGTKIILGVDTDKNGVNMLELEINLGEGMEELAQKFVK